MPGTSDPNALRTAASSNSSPTQRRLAKVVKRCQELPGADFTAKDYRTWAGTAMALAVLRELEWQPEVLPGKAKAS